MKKLILIIILPLIALGLYSQTNQYEKTFDWVVETFSQNDAGYQYGFDKKGEDAYNLFTKEIKSRLANVNNDKDFVVLVNEWLHFFRKGHVDFALRKRTSDKDDSQNTGKIKEDLFVDNAFHLDKLNDKTLYLRIPSFQYEYKMLIDSIIDANASLITTTENLIIDIRNGTGGSDDCFEKLLPFIYTNPIRMHGMVLKASELNAQGFDYYAEQTGNSEYNDIAKLLRDNKGKFVPMGASDSTYVLKLAAKTRNPERIAIIINEKNLSTDEQFLLYAKQSWKVKLFGRTTFGAIDISNVSFAYSPDNKYYLAYSMSKSKRIPHFIVDDIGLQPDYFIDDEIPENEWIKYTQEMLEN